MVRTLAHEAVGESVLDVDEAQFIDHIFDFGSKSLEDIMTLRSDICFLPLDTPLDAAIKEQRNTRHTKIPVFRENRDAIEGILHARDLLQPQTTPDASNQYGGLGELLREPYFVPETKPASELFETFRERKLSIALTVDEYGGVTGLVTMEDLLECIFGSIRSPSDGVSTKFIQSIDAGLHEVDGAIPIGDLNQVIGSNFSDDSSETLGGLLLNEFGELPPEDTVITIDGLRFTIKEVKENRIKKVVLEQTVDVEVAPESAKSDEAANSEQNQNSETPTTDG
jgi:putative hemolysin